MLRSENSRNTFGVSEFGSVKDSLEFNYLYEMDVYHHIKKGIKYPSMLLTAGLNDTKVDWWNPAKAVARFQKLNSGMDNIILFNINTAGHDGEGDKIMEETNFYSFLLWQLNHKLINTN
jgi:prolyl oligopeptidase